MIKLSLRISILVYLALFILACRTLPAVYNVENSVFTTAVRQELTMEQIKTAITQAGTNNGWTMKPEGEGRLVATLFGRREQMAQVDIQYNSKSYSITYKDSQGLKYDAEAGTIHSGYNRWVQTLQRVIEAKVAALE